MMRQILYVSTSTVPGDGADLTSILEQSRHNNAIDGITGLLWSDGRRFMQAFEGPQESVRSTWSRIQADDRHHDITILRDALVGVREFGTWTMAHRRSGEPGEVYDAKIRRLLERASPEVRQPFLAMLSVRPGS